MREKFEEYYNSMASRLTSYLVASGSTYANSCEIVQESFLKMWKMRDQLDDNVDQVRGLLWTIARNIRTDRFRKEKRLVYDAEAGIDAVAKVTSPGTSEDILHLRKRINEALASLPPILRDAYTLFHVAELSVREIAQQTNASESLVKVRIFRAKEKLQELLKDLRTW